MVRVGLRLWLLGFWERDEYEGELLRSVEENYGRVRVVKVGLLWLWYAEGEGEYEYEVEPFRERRRRRPRQSSR